MQRAVIFTRYTLRFMLAAILLYAAFIKWKNPQLFLVDIRNYHLLPEVLVPWATKIMLGVEFLLGVFLLFGIWKLEIAWITVGLFVIFAVVVGSALVRKLELSCGCFGQGNTPMTWWKFAGNMGLLALALMYALLQRKNIKKRSSEL